MYMRETGRREKERERGEERNSLEFPDPFEHTPILVSTEMVIVSSSVPRVKGMKPNNVE